MTADHGDMVHVPVLAKGVGTLLVLRYAQPNPGARTRPI